MPFNSNQDNQFPSIISTISDILLLLYRRLLRLQHFIATGKPSFTSHVGFCFSHCFSLTSSPLLPLVISLDFNVPILPLYPQLQVFAFPSSHSSSNSRRSCSCITISIHSFILCNPGGGSIHWLVAMQQYSDGYIVVHCSPI